MIWTKLETGRSYRLLRELEVRDERTGTMKAFFPKGAVLKVRDIATDEDRVFVDGLTLPIPLGAFMRMVEPAAS